MKMAATKTCSPVERDELRARIGSLGETFRVVSFRTFSPLRIHRTVTIVTFRQILQTLSKL